MRSDTARLMSPVPPHVLDAILRTDFVSFIRKVFQTVSPGEHFLENWHIEAMAYHLLKVVRGETRRLGDLPQAGRRFATGQQQQVVIRWPHSAKRAVEPAVEILGHEQHRHPVVIVGHPGRGITHDDGSVLAHEGLRWGRHTLDSAQIDTAIASQGRAFPSSCYASITIRGAARRAPPARPSRTRAAMPR